MLEDFDLFVTHILNLCQNQFGFLSPMLFMHDPAHDRLILAHGESQLKFPLQDAHHLLAQSFRERQLFTTHAYQEIFEEPSDEPRSSDSQSLFILLPISVLETPVGVLVFTTKDQKTLSHLEQIFLQNFVEQIALQLMTTWALKHSLEINESLEETNKEYLQLIEVKRTFLVQVRELLLQYREEESVDAKTKEELLSALSYLQSVLLLSDSTIEKNTQNDRYEQPVNAQKQLR